MIRSTPASALLALAVSVVLSVTTSNGQDFTQVAAGDRELGRRAKSENTVGAAKRMESQFDGGRPNLLGL